MNLADCQALIDHAQWADALTWTSVLRGDHDDAELRKTLYHLHAAQWVYLHVWRGEPIAPRAPGSFSGLATLREWAREYHLAVSRHPDGTPEADTGRDINFPWRDELVQRFGPENTTSWSDSVLQVAMHSAYHRGQVARRVRELGGEPPVTDYIAWVWLGRPAAEWG